MKRRPPDSDSRRRSAPIPEQMSLPWSPLVAEDVLPEITGGQTLAGAQSALKIGLADGTNCPCCGKHAQNYRRSLNSTMARSLIWLVRMSGASREWVEVQEIGPAWLLRSKQLPTLRLWSLVERRPKDPGDTSRRSSGIWRPTNEGIDYAYGRITVPKTVIEYRSQVIGYDEENQAHIRRSLGKKFDYFDLMGWQPEPPPESAPTEYDERNPPPFRY
jgi:hypothetical protein